MTAEQSYTVKVLHALQASLAATEHAQKAALIGKVAAKIARADNVGLALEELYSVREWDVIALRLMWYARRRQQAGEEYENPEVEQFEVGELIGLLLPRQAEPPSAPLLPGPPRRRQGLDELSAALNSFGDALVRLRRSSFEGETFKGVSQEAIDMVLLEATGLQHTALASSNDDVARFATAFGFFVHYVTERSLLRDVRVANFLETANLTLQTVLEAVGGEDYDSLTQTIELLENPKTLFE